MINSNIIKEVQEFFTDKETLFLVRDNRCGDGCKDIDVCGTDTSLWDPISKDKMDIILQNMNYEGIYRLKKDLKYQDFLEEVSKISAKIREVLIDGTGTLSEGNYRVTELSNNYLVLSLLPDNEYTCESKNLTVNGKVDGTEYQINLSCNIVIKL